MIKKTPRWPAPLRAVGEVVRAVASGPTASKTADERWSICQTCPHLQGSHCGKCGCYMPAKVRFRSVTCPDKRWT